MKNMRLICTFLCHGLFPYTRRVNDEIKTIVL
jgi:hypothetical protein